MMSAVKCYNANLKVDRKMHEYLKTKGNSSEYIRQLIAKDMKKMQPMKPTATDRLKQTQHYWQQQADIAYMPQGNRNYFMDASKD